MVSMRRFLVALVCALVVVPAAAATRVTAGDGVLELKAVAGTVSIGTALKPARGALWGQMDSGLLKVTDPVAGDGKIYVSNWDTRTAAYTDAGLVVTYTGRDLHFRVTGGTYRLWFKGSGIDLTAVGVGIVRLNGDTNVPDAGSYAVDDADWSPVPEYVLASQSKTITFGDLSTLTSP